MPIASAAEASTPPTPSPALRNAPTKPNQTSRSPGRLIEAIIGPFAPQKQVRPSAATATSTPTTTGLRASG